MKAKRLLMALLFAVLVSGLFTFWMSRRPGQVDSCRDAKEATVCCLRQGAGRG